MAWNGPTASVWRARTTGSAPPAAARTARKLCGTRTYGWLPKICQTAGRAWPSIWISPVPMPPTGNRMPVNRSSR